MARHPGAIPPQRQRRFDRAFHALAALCPGRERRLSDFKLAGIVQCDPIDLERARWLIVAMGHARGTGGGLAIAQLARLGYAVTSQHGRWLQPKAVVPLDTQGLLHLGHVLPSQSVQWKRLEAVALATDPVALPARHWCSAHETLQVHAALLAEGHDLGSADREALAPASDLHSAQSVGETPTHSR